MQTDKTVKCLRDSPPIHQCVHRMRTAGWAKERDNAGNRTDIRKVLSPIKKIVKCAYRKYTSSYYSAASMTKVGKKQNFRKYLLESND